MREIALDTETTGLDPNSGHRLVEIGCVEMENHIRTGNVFHCYLNPERDMPREAEAIHGLSGEFLKNKPLFSSIAASFLEFIGTDPLVIHNASFDLKFLNAELNRLGLSLIPAERATDTVLIARRMFPGQPASLDALCKRFSIDLSARTKHGALLDAELLADVYLELKGGRQSSMLALGGEAASATQHAPDGAAIGAGDLAFQQAGVLPVRDFAPTADELAAHRIMLGKIKAPLWGTGA